jgi:hypothetical protein
MVALTTPAKTANVIPNFITAKMSAKMTMRLSSHKPVCCDVRQFTKPQSGLHCLRCQRIRLIGCADILATQVSTI